MAEPRTPARPFRVRSLASPAGSILALALFVSHAGARSAALADLERGKEGRSWEDMSLAAGYALQGEFPVAAWEVRTSFFPREDPAFVAFRADLRRETAAAGIRPWQFWRTIPATRFLDRRRYLASISDDPGRARLLGWGFRMLGGISPYLVSWLAVVACLPLLAWTAWEFHDARRPVAGAAFLAQVGLSPYVVETLQLPYSAAGFYLLAALALVPFAVQAVLGRSRSRRGLAGRVALAAIAIGFAASGRHGTLLLVPAFVLCLARALSRVASGDRLPRRAVSLAAGAAALVAPYLALTALTDRLILRTARSHGAAAVTVRHRPWLSLWEGLGDFDRSKGYEWRDAAARRFAAEEGAGRLLGPRSERLFREKILRDVREDPIWYAGILARRALATATQWKLRPWSRADGVSVAPAASPNEGLVDAYYRLTTTVDWLGIADHRVEVPLPLMWLPTAALLFLALVRRAGAEGRWSEIHVLGAVGLGLAALPVLVSTASGLETQAFALVYFLGFAFLLERLARRALGPGKDAR